MFVCFFVVVTNAPDNTVFGATVPPHSYLAIKAVCEPIKSEP